MMNNNIPNVPKDKFKLVGVDSKIHDVKFDTKPIGFFKDAMMRFAKNKSSIVAAIIILMQLLFAIIAPLCSRYTVSFRDPYYVTVLPSFSINARNAHGGFWDGSQTRTGGTAMFDKLSAIGYETAYTSEKTQDHSALIRYTKTTDEFGDSYEMYYDTYYEVGYVYKNLSEEEYLQLQEYQNKTGIQVIYPLQKNYTAVGANYWYRLDDASQAAATEAQANKVNYVEVSKASAGRDSNGDLVPDYLTSSNANAYGYNSLKLSFEGTKYEDGTKTESAAPINQKFSAEESYPVLYDSIGNRYRWYSDAVGYVQEIQVDGQYVKAYTEGSASVDGDWYADSTKADKLVSKPLYYCYAIQNQTGYKVRVCYYEYFKYVNGFYPNFVFGSNVYGQDILTCLASGARLSFLLAISVCIINFTIGAIYGAIEGYYGGAADILMERFSDILSAVPFMVVATLFQLHLADKAGPVGSLIFAFVLTGWIGMASRVRMQFYRFKGQEYVLAARTLGAGDGRIIWKHIFPNTLGTIITGSVLAIPGVIFSESMLSYLGIVNLTTSNYTSIGTMLSQGNGLLATFPHVIFFPALFIALLEISFNLFGNGLRDAFNPSLRGTED